MAGWKKEKRKKELKWNGKDFSFLVITSKERKRIGFTVPP